MFFFRTAAPEEQASTPTESTEPQQQPKQQQQQVPLSIPVKGSEGAAGQDGQRMYLLQNKRLADGGQAVGSVSMADFHLVHEGEYHNAGGAKKPQQPPKEPHQRGKKGKRVPRNTSLDDWVILSPTKGSPSQQ